MNSPPECCICSGYGKANSNDKKNIFRVMHDGVYIIFLPIFLPLNSTLFNPLRALGGAFAPAAVAFLVTLQQHAVHRQAAFGPDAADPARVRAQLLRRGHCKVAHVERMTPLGLGVQRQHEQLAKPRVQRPAQQRLLVSRACWSRSKQPRLPGPRTVVAPWPGPEAPVT